MKKMTNYVKYLALALPVLWTGCNDDKPEALLPADFEDGVFISNEGNFGEGDGSLSYYDFMEEKVYNNVFSKVNDGKDLGDVVQSLHLTPEMLFVIVNNSNKAEGMNLEDHTNSYTINDLKLPRYMVSQSGKGYISEWVSFSDQGRVAVVDLATGTIQKTITTDYGAEGLIIAENKLFVSNNFSTTVSIIDLSTEAVIKTLSVGSSPGLFTLDADGDIWLVCAGGFDDQFLPVGDGKLFEIDPATLSIETEMDLGMNVSTKISGNSSNDQIYYFSGTSLYSMDISATSAPAAPLISSEEITGLYGIGAEASGLIYLADNKGFIESGEVFIYEPDGTFVSKFMVGRGPNAFAFN